MFRVIAFVLLLVTPFAPAFASSGGCDFCKLAVVCQPDCVITAVCQGTSRFGQQGRYECDDSRGYCSVGGSYCQWTELRGEPPANRLALVPLNLCPQSGT
jgi:hypothetical protein